MRDTKTNPRRSWRPIKRRMRLRLAGIQKIALLSLLLLLQLAAYVLYGWYHSTVSYGMQGPPVDAKGNQIIFPGEFEPRDSKALNGMTTGVRRYTPSELDAAFGDMDFIYTFVNGSEPNHAFRRSVVLSCLRQVTEAERAQYAGEDARGRCPGSRIAPNSPRNRDVLAAMGRFSSPATLSARDRERDELRYSIRSVEQHMRWHRGRLLLVSPGHPPRWVRNAVNFMRSACPPKTNDLPPGSHPRITTVHQDAIMPYGMRLTIDSHAIEQHLFRVRNITPIHVFLNDDYFVYRDVAVSDLLNEYGGTYVRTEGGMLSKAARADNGSSWVGGVHNTNLFNVLELDYRGEGYLPPALLKRWEAAGINASEAVPVPSTDALIHTAHAHPPESMPAKMQPRRPRFFATHAPFVYCTRMFEFFNRRYEREIAHNALIHRSRKATDLFVPFVYNAFIMARPWQASPRFLPYAVSLHKSRAKGSKEPTPEPIHIGLDNRDGCAPATLLRRPASDAMYAKFVDEYDKNIETISSLKKQKPLFFNINDGFSMDNTSVQLKKFLLDLFPHPSFVEERTKPLTTTQIGDKPREGQQETQQDEQHEEQPEKVRAGEYDEVYRALMKLPLVIFTSYTESFCPLVRSIQLVLQDFNGPILLVHAPHLGSEGELGDDLASIRARLKHRVRSMMPVTRCTFGKNVHIIEVSAGATLRDQMREALQHIDATPPVPLPDNYMGGNEVRVAALAIDARVTHPIDSVAALTRALHVPAQTVALADFETHTMHDGNSALLLALHEAERRAVHWVNGASEEDLLVTFPLPSAEYEDLDALVKWTH